MATGREGYGIGMGLSPFSCLFLLANSKFFVYLPPLLSHYSSRDLAQHSNPFLGGLWSFVLSHAHNVKCLVCIQVRKFKVYESSIMMEEEVFVS